MPGPKHLLEQPRAVTIIDGMPFLPMSYQIQLNAHGTADSGNVTLPMTTFDWTAYIIGKQPSTVTAKTSALAGAIPIQVYAGYPQTITQLSTDITNLSLRFAGIVDMDKPDFKASEVQFPIRSLASLLLSNKTTTAAQNMTSFQFIENAASMVGLKLNVQLLPGQKPTTLANVYAHDMVVGLRNLKNWDIIVACAEVDDADVWVDQYGVLNYCSPSVVQRQISYLQFDHGDFETYGGEHAAQFSKNIQVEVRSYTPKTRFSCYARYTTGADGSGTPTSGSATGTSTPVWGQNASDSTTTRTSSTGTSSTSVTSSTSAGGSANENIGGAVTESSKEQYVYHIAGLSKEEASRRAYIYWRQISMHEQQVTFSCPMTKALLPYVLITTFFQTSACPWPSWNTKWWPRRITENFSIQQDPGGESEGWSFDVDAVNHTLSQQAV